jgi:hypothetical protein
MCRNIRTLHHLEPPATDEETRASALQYVRKLSGYHSPSRRNQAAFDRAVGRVTDATRELLASLHAPGPLRNRETQRLKAIRRGVQRERRRVEPG